MSTPIAAPLPSEIHYFTVIVPYVEPKRATEYHPDRPGEKLSRGAFPSLEVAATWAKDRLDGAPYGITEVGYSEERGDWSRVMKAVPTACPTCHGDGSREIYDGDAARLEVGGCPTCDGTGKLPVCPRCLDLTPGEAGGDPAAPHPGPFTEALCAACSRVVEIDLRAEGRDEAANYEAAQRS